MGVTFDGSTDWYNGVDDVRFRLQSPFSWLYWIKSTTSSNLVIMEVGNNENSNFSSGALDGRIEFVTEGLNTRSTTDAHDGEWRHIGSVLQADDDAHNYLDGVNDDSGISASADPVYAGSETLHIGARSGAIFWVGDLYCVAYFSEDIIDTHVAAVFRGAHPFGFSGINLLYPFDAEGDQGSYGNGDLILSENGTPVKSATNPPVELIENYL